MNFYSCLTQIYTLANEATYDIDRSKYSNQIK